MLRKSFQILKIGIFIGIPILLLLLPADFFDSGQSLSLFELLGADGYYSKGMTRACMHLMHLNFETAWSYNPLSYAVLPLLSFVWLTWGMREIRIFRQGNTGTRRSVNPASKRFQQLGLLALIAIPGLIFILALNQYFIPRTGFNFALAMPLTVIAGGLGTVTFHQTRKQNWSYRLAGISLYSLVLVVGLLVIYRAYAVPPADLLTCGVCGYQSREHVEQVCPVCNVNSGPAAIQASGLHPTEYYYGEQLAFFLALDRNTLEEWSQPLPSAGIYKRDPTWQPEPTPAELEGVLEEIRAISEP